MKTLSMVKLASLIALMVFSLVGALLWGAGQSVAAAPDNTDIAAKQIASVQDDYEGHGLQLKLLMHRPGQAPISSGVAGGRS